MYPICLKSCLSLGDSRFNFWYLELIFSCFLIHSYISATTWWFGSHVPKKIKLSTHFEPQWGVLGTVFCTASRKLTSPKGVNLKPGQYFNILSLIRPELHFIVKKKNLSSFQQRETRQVSITTGKCTFRASWSSRGVQKEKEHSFHQQYCYPILTHPYKASLSCYH